ncbi:MAG: hypothetical protein ACR2M1_10500 [Gemmatimonadaceae bacterium]
MTDRIALTVPSMDDVLRGVTTAHLRAIDNARSLSAQLETEQPSDMISGSDDDGYDAFGRLVEHSGIVTGSNPSAGVHATQIGKILSGEHVMPDGQKIGRAQGRAIAMIWADRQWRRVKYGRSPNTRGMFTVEDDVVNTALRPYTDAANFRELTSMQPNLPLSAIVAQETAIDGDSFRSVYVDETNVGDFDYTRVTEAADIPTVDLRTHEQTVHLFKRGRGINWSYEAARNMRLDKFQLVIMKMAIDVENGKAATALRTLIAGDGNAATSATVVNMTSLDPALTAGSPLNLRAYLGFKKLFRGAFMFNTFIGNISDIVNFELIPIGLTSTPLVALNGQDGNTLGTIQNIRAETFRNIVSYADVDTGIIPTGNFLGFDRRFAIERISQIGATVSEADSFIGNQTNLLTFTDVDGFDVLYAKASKLINTLA